MEPHAKPYLDLKESTFLAFLIMMSLYKSFKKVASLGLR